MALLEYSGRFEPGISAFYSAFWFAFNSRFWVLLQELDVVEIVFLVTVIGGWWYYWYLVSRGQECLFSAQFGLVLHNNHLTLRCEFY